MFDAASGIEWEIEPTIINFIVNDNVVTVILCSINEKWFSLFKDTKYGSGNGNMPCYDGYQPKCWTRKNNELTLTCRYDDDIEYAKRIIRQYIEDTSKRYFHI